MRFFLGGGGFALLGRGPQDPRERFQKKARRFYETRYNLPQVTFH